MSISMQIKVKSLNNNAKWIQDINADEDSNIESMCKPESNGKNVAFFKAAIMPVRTNNLKNFMHDLLLPSTFNQALRVNSTVGKVFEGLARACFDLVTLPIRCITSVYRVISNAKHRSLVYQYLKKNNANTQVLESEKVIVKVIKRLSQNQILIGDYEPCGWSSQQQNSSTEYRINLMDVPIDFNYKV